MNLFKPQAAVVLPLRNLQNLVEKISHRNVKHYSFRQEISRNMFVATSENHRITDDSELQERFVPRQALSEFKAEYFHAAKGNCTMKFRKRQLIDCFFSALTKHRIF